MNVGSVRTVESFTVEFSVQVWFVGRATSHLNLDLCFVPFKRVSVNLKLSVQ